ncbi:MAG: hypothetical protein ACYTET_02675 [Planctomycetota bacterium]|jgi:hypothetical protein
MTRVAFAPIGLIALMMIAVFIPATIIILVKGGKTTRIVIGSIFLVGLLLFLGLFGLRAVSVPQTCVITEHAPSQHADPVPQFFAEDPGLWQISLEEELIPDVYSSKETAAFGLGMQLLETIQAASEPMPEKILILESGAGGDLALAEQFRKGLKTVLNETHVAISKPTTEMPGKHQLWVELNVENEHSHNNEITIPELTQGDVIHMSQKISIGNTNGKVQAVVQSANGKFIKEVSYEHRPWVFEPESLQNHYFRNGNGRWPPTVFRSYSTATTEQQAIEQALERVRQHLHHVPFSEHIQLDTLRQHGMINDRYTQKLQGLSGPIWRAALLVDLSEQRLSKLRHDQATLHQAEVMAERSVRRSWAGLIVQFVGMIALICLVYIVINALTKGYYSFKLGFIAVILVLILSGLILLMH